MSVNLMRQNDAASGIAQGKFCELFMRIGLSWRRMTKEKSPAFSLIELLIVIAIIAILAALVLPVLNRGAQSAARSKCINNLRQLGLAVEMYWDDNESSAFR